MFVDACLARVLPGDLLGAQFTPGPWDVSRTDRLQSLRPSVLG